MSERAIDIVVEALGISAPANQFGEDRELHDTFVATMSYFKGRGYVLSAAIERRTLDGSTRVFQLVTGIEERHLYMSAKRFSAKTLAECAAQASWSLVPGLRTTCLAELARRKSNGKSY